MSRKSLLRTEEKKSLPVPASFFLEGVSSLPDARGDAQPELPPPPTIRLLRLPLFPILEVVEEDGDEEE